MAEREVRRIDDCRCESSVDRFACPCCGYLTLEVSGGTAEHEICKVCFWQHDHVDEADPDAAPMGPNHVSLSEARANFAAFGASERRHLKSVRAPRADERPEGREMSAITDLFAGVSVSDLDASIDWYTRFFGRAPDSRVGEEILWEIDEHAWLFIEPNPAQAGAGRITLAVTGLDALLERLASQGIEHEPIETYSNGVRHVNVPDPDENAIALAEPPDGASASPRSAG